MIVLEEVRKSFRTSHGEVLALDGISLNVEQGEFVAIQGHSGSGKSTLLSLVGGLALPTAGRVLVKDQDLAQLDSAARAKFRNENVGFVFQLFHLLPYLNVVDNVLVAAPTSETREKLRPEAEKLLEQFGLSDRVAHRPAQLSAGERQRVAMARALLNRPQLLIADEPTGNLDRQNATLLLEMLSDFHSQGGTILLATHDADAAGTAQRQLELNKGRVGALS